MHPNDRRTHRPDYAIEVDNQLQGTLDHLIEVKNRLLVIEAKREDLTRGFTQLAVELVALDKWLDHQERVLYGAVSTGAVWQFGILDRTEKHLVQDLGLFTVPAQLEELIRTIIGILAETRAE